MSTCNYTMTRDRVALTDEGNMGVGVEGGEGGEKEGEEEQRAFRNCIFGKVPTTIKTLLANGSASFFYYPTRSFCPSPNFLVHISFQFSSH